VNGTMKFKLIAPGTLTAFASVLLAVYAVKVMLPSTPVRLQCDDLTAGEQPEVVLFGTSWCALCKKSRWFLEDNDIAYCEYDIEQSTAGAARYQQLGGRTIPLIMIGSQRVEGFNKKNIAVALRQEGFLN
jgi:glutaredoxin